MRAESSRIVLAFLSACVLGCASGSGGPAPPSISAADCSNVPRNLVASARTEPRNDGNGATIYIMNLTDCPISITSVVLRECQGIRGTCDTSIRRRMELAPGQEKMVYVVRYTGNTGSYFRYSYTWQYIRN
jgi:hypothetical protein